MAESCMNLSGKSFDSQENNEKEKEVFLSCTDNNPAVVVKKPEPEPALGSSQKIPVQQSQQWEDDFMNESLKGLGQDNHDVVKQQEEAFEESKVILAKISQPNLQASQPMVI